MDLSHTFRLSGLPSGAQLELVQSSRTAAPINVALQLPASEDNIRLTDKFPSTTSLWQILRAFESGAAGGRTPANFTQRGTARQQNGSSGAGRLYYETPVLNIMSRELASFVDLQKTLVQLGVTSGSALLRLSFKGTDQPLEEAMVEISEYFQNAKSNEPIASGSGNPPLPREPAFTAAAPAGATGEENTIIANSNNQDTAAEAAQELASSTQEAPPSTGLSQQRALKVFLAPTTSTPAAAAQPYNENDYVPTIEHAKLHQARLSSAGRNQRLLSDAELAKQGTERQARLDAVNKVKVRVRFPDQTTIETSFGREDTGRDVYEFVRNLMTNGGERFSLAYVGSKAGHVSLRDGPQKLIADDGWKGSMLINLIWDESVSAQVKRQRVLREDISKQAVPLTFETPAVEEEPEQKSEKPSGGIFGQKSKDSDRQKSVEAKLKGLLGLGKKK